MDERSTTRLEDDARYFVESVLASNQNTPWTYAAKRARQWLKAHDEKRKGASDGRARKDK